MQKKDKISAKGKNQASAGTTLYLVSLGCSKNLVDSEVIAGTLLTAGRTLTFDPDEADLYVINTCAFIAAAREEATQAIKAGIAWKRQKRGRLLVVAGCLTEWDKDGLFRQKYPEVDLWTGVNQVAEIARLLDHQNTLLSREKAPVYLYNEITPRLQLTMPHLAYLKIADGCNNHCTYCSIPGIRGKLRTRPIDSVVREADNLIKGGVRELLIIAQDITAYGHDRPESQETLTGLLTALNALEGDFVIRLFYTHPAHYTEEFIDFMSQRKSKVLPYLDIPLQHISDRILTKMNRHITRKETEALLTKLRERIPNLTLRTTFITGFPGETEEEFQELKDFARNFKFERCGFFTYSPEPGTPAAAFPKQIPPEIAEQRAQELMLQQNSIMQELNARQIGKTMRVIVDYKEKQKAVARGAMDAPEIDNYIYIPNPKKLKSGEFYQVKIIGTDHNDLIGEIAK